MNRLTKSIIILLTLASYTLAQTTPKPARFLGRFLKGDFDEFIYKKASLALDSDLTKNKIIIRICSVEDMQWTLATASGNPLATIEMLKTFNISADQIYFSRFSKCQNKQNKLRETELWLLSAEDNLESDEMINSKKIQLDFFPIAANQETFDENLNLVLKKLRDDVTEFKPYIVGYFNKKPSKVLRNNVNKTYKKLLKIRNRKFIPKPRFLEWSSIPFDRKTEPSYPSIMLISIKG